MAYANSQLAHVWAQQNKASGKNGNSSFSFEGKSLFSYRTEIARFIDGKVVQTNQKYSVTTTGKHANQIHRATNHLEHYYVDRHMRELPDSWNEVKKIIFADMMTAIKAEIALLKRARTRLTYSFDHLCDLVRDANNFSLKYNIKVKKEDQKLINGLNSNNATTGMTLRANFLKENYSIDLVTKIQSERAKEEKEQQAFLERNKQLVKEENENLIKWLNDTSYSKYFSFIPVHLRLNNNEIETSRGAKIPLDDAKHLYAKMKAHEPIEGFRVGQFTVNSLDLTKNIITIGCHEIPLQQIENMALRLGLTKE